jgi:hypothetical protein
MAGAIMLKLLAKTATLSNRSQAELGIRFQLKPSNSFSS